MINHPLRRKIVSWLMVLGNAGIVAVIITATSSLVTSSGYKLPINVVLLAAGIGAIYKIATHKGFIRRWESFIENRLVETTAFEEAPVEDLLHLIEGHGLVRAIIKEGSPLAGMSLLEFRSDKEGLVVLGIERERAWLPVPRLEELIKAGDKLVVYGPLKTLKGLLKDE